MVSFAVIESKHLLIKVTEQMIRLNRNISPFESALQETPKVLNAVRVNLTVNVLLCVVNYLVNIIIVQTAITFPSVRKQVRARFNTRPYFGVQRQLRGIWNH